MINSVHYFLENNNRVIVNTILVYMYILKRTRVTPKIEDLYSGNGFTDHVMRGDSFLESVTNLISNIFLNVQNLRGTISQTSSITKISGCS